MAQSANYYGTLNSKAAPELSRFAFLIGSWKCEAKLLSADGTWQTFKAAWLGHYILDRYAIADEYRMFNPSGELIVLGMNFRTYDAANELGTFVGSTVWQETGLISCRRNWAA